MVGAAVVVVGAAVVVVGAAVVVDKFSGKENKVELKSSTALFYGCEVQIKYICIYFIFS